MTLLEENIARLKAEGKYHPDAIQASPEPVKVESVLVPATVTDPSARELARRAVAPDNDASLSGDLRKLWNKLREHSSDNPITKDDLCKYMWPTKENFNKDEGSSSVARNIRGMIHDLVFDHFKLVGSTANSRHPGYYAIQSEKDLRICNVELAQKAVALYDRIKFNNDNWEILKGSIKPAQPEQMTMDINKKYAQETVE
jgi:hypothetical protein